MTAAEQVPPVDLDAIRARCDAATDEPWNYAPEHLMVAADLETLSPGHISYLSAVARFDDLDGETEEEFDARITANAEFIAHARTDVPALLALVEQQAAEIDMLRAGLDDARTRLRRAWGVADRGVFNARRWEHPVPVPSWVEDLWAALVPGEGQRDAGDRRASEWVARWMHARYRSQEISIAVLGRLLGNSADSDSGRE